MRLQFKKEVALLLLAISLFTIGTFFYTYQAYSLATGMFYPYRSLALAFVGIGFASMIAASISYQRKTKNMAKELAA